jgi:hypothetical protein
VIVREQGGISKRGLYKKSLQGNGFRPSSTSNYDRSLIFNLQLQTGHSGPSNCQNRANLAFWVVMKVVLHFLQNSIPFFGQNP